MNPFRSFMLRTAPRLASPLLVAAAATALFAQDNVGKPAGPAGDPLQPAARPQTPSARERFHRYVADAFGPAALLAAGIAAATDQPVNAPPEWKQGAAGFERRMASRFGQFAVAETARYGLAAAFDLDTRYRGCECRGALPRLGHALLSSVTARAADGRRAVSLPDLVAPYAGGLAAASAWYPSRFGPKDGVRMGTWAFGIHAGVSIVREFLPRRR
jgi:hypothetical protein